MKTLSEINQIILDEIENLEVDKGMQNFLGDILMTELNYIDKDRWNFSELYERLLEEFYEERSKK